MATVTSLEMIFNKIHSISFRTTALITLMFGGWLDVAQRAGVIHACKYSNEVIIAEVYWRRLEELDLLVSSTQWESKFTLPIIVCLLFGQDVFLDTADKYDQHTPDQDTVIKTHLPDVTQWSLINYAEDDHVSVEFHCLPCESILFYNGMITNAEDLIEQRQATLVLDARMAITAFIYAAIYILDDEIEEVPLTEDFLDLEEMTDLWDVESLDSNIRGC